MKILFVSDIHGCLPTLQQVLSFYDREHYDMLCILRDILSGIAPTAHILKLFGFFSNLFNGFCYDFFDFTFYFVKET